MKITQLIEVLKALLETRIRDSYVGNKYAPDFTGAEAICRYRTFLKSKKMWNDWKDGLCSFRTIEVEIEEGEDPIEVTQMLARDKVVLDSRHFFFPSYKVGSKKFNNAVEDYLRDSMQKDALLVLDALKLDTQCNSPIENLKIISWVNVEEFTRGLCEPEDLVNGLTT